MLDDPADDRPQVQAGGHRLRERGALRPASPSPASATCWRSSARATGRKRRPTSPRGYTQYGPLKADAGEAVVELLTPIQARYRELLDDPAELAALLRTGADKARAVASATLQRAYDAIGLLPA